VIGEGGEVTTQRRVRFWETLSVADLYRLEEGRAGSPPAPPLGDGVTPSLTVYTPDM